METFFNVYLLHRSTYTDNLNCIIGHLIYCILATQVIKSFHVCIFSQVSYCKFTAQGEPGYEGTIHFPISINSIIQYTDYFSQATYMPSSSTPISAPVARLHINELFHSSFYEAIKGSLHKEKLGICFFRHPMTIRSLFFAILPDHLNTTAHIYT